MLKPLETELVGVLIGTLMANSKPIVVSLYIEPDGSGHSRMYEYNEVCTPWWAAETLLQAYGPAVRALWRNTFTPPWYYIQLYPGADPSYFLLWSLPWSCLADWNTTETPT